MLKWLKQEFIHELFKPSGFRWVVNLLKLLILAGVVMTGYNLSQALKTLEGKVNVTILGNDGDGFKVVGVKAEKTFPLEALAPKPNTVILQIDNQKGRYLTYCKDKDLLGIPLGFCISGGQRNEKLLWGVGLKISF